MSGHQRESTQNQFDQAPLIKTKEHPTSYDTGYLPRTSLPERKPLAYRNRYNRPQRTLNSIKDLIITPEYQGVRSVEGNYQRGGSPFMERIVEKNKHIYSNKEVSHINMEQKRIEKEKQEGRVRKVYNRMTAKLQKMEEKAKIIGHLSKKLRPIAENLAKNKQESDSKMMQLEIKVGEARQIQFLTEVQKHVSKALQPKNRLLEQANRYKYYRLSHQNDLCSIFNIQSIEPYNGLNDKKSSTFLKNKRKNAKIQIYQVLQGKQVKRKQIRSNLALEDRKVQLQLQNNILEKQDCYKKIQSQHSDKSQKTKYNKLFKIVHKFLIPFQTFYYRDFLWKINWTNQIFVEPPLQYQHRLKVFVGKGNNSCMVRGLINRRYWFAFTQRIQEANFVWTQLKQLQYFKTQNSRQKIVNKIQNSSQYIPQSALTLNDSKRFKAYWQNWMRVQEHGDQRLLNRLKMLKYSQIVKPQQIRSFKMHNHLKNNYIVGNKKALLNTMRNYYIHNKKDPFDYLPLSYHIVKGLEDPQFLQFQRFYHKRNRQIKKINQDKQNLWIVKPGECTNRGQGIKVCHTMKEIKQIVKTRQWWADGSQKTYIIQSYIQKPLLYKKRKFDLRHYILMTCIKGCIKGYWYTDGYVRTSSSEYKVKDSDFSIHLTNDAIQKFLPDYGKYQKGNKLSYEQLELYIQKVQKGKSFYKDVYPQMKTIAIDIIKASARYIDPTRLQNNFQIFGLDFMIEADLKVWLIEINSNPCLELSCPLLTQIIPNMVQNALQMTLDTMYPPPVRFTPKNPRYFSSLQNANKFQLVFDQRIQEGFMGNQSALNSKLLKEQDEVFEDDGSQWEDN